MITPCNTQIKSHLRFNSSSSSSIDNNNNITKSKQNQNQKKRKKQKTTIQSLKNNHSNNISNDSILSLINNHNNNNHNNNNNNNHSKSNNSHSINQIDESLLKPLISITVGESINFDKVLQILKTNENFNFNLNSNSNFSIIVPDEVINLKYQGSDLMILSNGTLIGWNLTESTILNEILPIFKESIFNLYNPESEEMDFIEIEIENLNTLKTNDNISDDNNTNDGSFMYDEIIIIQGDNKLLDKVAFAIGLSRSTRLSILEDSLEKHIQTTKINSEYLSIGKKITTTESDVLKLTGRLFLLRGKLNLYSELIETPDLYWNDSKLESIYNQISKILDIQIRISILNRKLDYATEEQRALLSVLNEKKSTRLEWIIIILIMVEVGFETFHFYERLVDEKKEKT